MPSGLFLNLGAGEFSGQVFFNVVGYSLLPAVEKINGLLM